MDKTDRTFALIGRASERETGLDSQGQPAAYETSSNRPGWIDRSLSPMAGDRHEGEYSERDDSGEDITDAGDDDESCPRCAAVNWGMTPDGRLECVNCRYTEPAKTGPPPTVTAKFPTAEDAIAFRQACDKRMKALYRKTVPALRQLHRAQAQYVIGGPVTKEEFVSAILEREYPVALLNETTHVLYHRGAWNSACEHCDSRCANCGHLIGQHYGSNGGDGCTECDCDLCPGYEREPTAAELAATPGAIAEEQAPEPAGRRGPR